MTNNEFRCIKESDTARVRRISLGPDQHTLESQLELDRRAQDISNHNEI